MKKIRAILLLTLFVASGFLLLVPATATNDEPMMELTRWGPPTPVPVDPPPQEIPWGITRVHAIEAAVVVDESTVIVAILDTGMDLDHPELAANYIWGYDFVNNDAIPEDDNGHGTHCAGTIAGIDNDIGVVGVAPNVGLYIIKVLDRRGSGSYDGITAGIYAATRGPDNIAGTNDDADVISMSLGGPVGTVELEAAINYALNYDVVVVVA